MFIKLHYYTSLVWSKQVGCRPLKAHFLVLAIHLIEAFLLRDSPVIIEAKSAAEFSGSVSFLFWSGVALNCGGLER
jgi:hypothetical protein